MKLKVGERLEGAGPAHQPGGYVVTSVVRETPWHGLYAAKKIFYNFDFTAKRVRETDDVEWLDVFLRTNRYPILDDPTYVQQRRALARAEVRAILGNRHSNLWPEPLDILEIKNTRDPFVFAEDASRGNEPIVVYTRPQGRFTPEWQEQILPVSSILSVLAELLEFIQQAHAEGLLLLGLGPRALLIDASDRVHFVGTEMVLSQQNALLKDATSAAAWQRLFPTDRFARGFTAPECFDPNKRPDVRADLYAWGAIAFNLLTGTDLAKIAREQGRPWATFLDSHWRELEGVLTQLPRNNLQLWAEQIGAPAEKLLTDWPRKFLTVFRLLLSPDPAPRPDSTEELLAWLVDPPPPPVADAIALYTDADAGKLLLDCTQLDPALEMTIQCAKGTAPRRASDGTTIFEGALRPVVSLRQLPLTTEPIFYTVFTRRKEAGRYAYSPGVVARLWQPTERNLRQWVEEQAAGTFDAQHVPTRVALVLGALDAQTAPESLRASPVVRVRAWALRRVEQTVRALGRLDASEPLLWRFLGDPNVELRQSAAATLWSFHADKSDELMLRIIEALEAPPLDAPIPLMQFLRQQQIPDDRIRALLQQLETKRPTECPLCKVPLTIGERATHLQAAHGYVIYQGDVFSIDAVFTRLWERTLEQQDRRAHEELTAMYLSLPDVKKNQDAAAKRYVDDLQRFLLGESKSGGGSDSIPVALPYECIVAYQANLRLSPWFLPIARGLLGSPHGRLRELGSQAALPYLQDQVRARPTVEELRRALNSLCAELDSTDQQIALCRQLAQLGIDQALIQSCIAQLQEERLVICTECQANVRTRDLELHLRRAHQVFQFRGARKTYVEMRGTILKAICTPPADMAAWKSLQSLAADRHAEDTDRYLVGWIYHFLKDVDVEARGAAIAALAEVLVAAEAVERLLPYFAGPAKSATYEQMGQWVALELCPRLPAPLPKGVLPLVLPFLDIKELSRWSRENAVLALMRLLGKDGPRIDDVLHAYVAQSTKKRGIEKLQQLEQRFGHSAVLDAVVREIEDEVRMSCPRCPTELRKKDMVVHLWDKHRLVLDGQRVREPWRVIEDWLVDYGLEKDPQVLQRCRELALKDDPPTGLARLQRLLYRRGLRDRDLLIELKTQVKSRKATLCPHCCATVTVANPPVVHPLAMDRKRLEGYGYHLEVSEKGLFPSLHIETPDTIVFHDREPGRFLTCLGGILFLIGPLATLTFLVLYALTRERFPAYVPAAVALGVALFGSGFVFLLWPGPGPAKDRLIKAAWKLLVPEILQRDTGPRAWGFLHGLMEISARVGRQKLNQDVLIECCEEASEAGRTDRVALACLATMSRHCIADMRDNGEDAFGFVLTLTTECFKGKLPLSFLGELLANFHGKERSAWTKCDLNRLANLVAQRAFTAEIDVEDWFNLGRAYPVLSSVLNLESRWHWLQFHALWSRKTRRPWESAGPALTMFELAKTPDHHEDLLAFYPDVLLYITKANLVIGTKGVWIEGVCVTSFQPGAEVSSQKVGAGYEIVVGTVCIRAAENPRDYLDAIKRWLRWYFQEFVPSVPTTPRPMTESRHRMWQLDKTACPDCGRALVACPSDLGVALR
ncbi:MAG: hypothetical protein EXR98_13170 [Gemmataceae bacterium]|nr:hypothetical protein [Gemmataceae bacterium]